MLIATQPDLGTALVIAFTLGALLLVAGTPIGLLGKIAAELRRGGCWLFAIADPERLSRLTTFVNPWGDPQRLRVFRPSRARSRSAPAGCSASGSASRVQKVFYLPEAHTDFILAVIGEELGVGRRSSACCFSTG